MTNLCYIHLPTQNIFAIASDTMFHFGGIDTPEGEVKNNMDEYKYIDLC